MIRDHNDNLQALYEFHCYLPDQEAKRYHRKHVNSEEDEQQQKVGQWKDPTNLHVAIIIMLHTYLYKL